MLLRQDFERELEGFCEVLERFRHEEGLRILDPAAYAELPGGPAASGSAEWRLRRYDLERIRRFLGGRGARTVLDVGSYNGWLANRLCRDGFEVTGVDYFADPFDGLGARRHYPRAEWLSVQLDLLDLSVLGRSYDVVVANRCLQFFPDPLDYFRHLRERVAPGGVLVLTGLAFFSDPRRKEAEIGGWQERHERRYGAPFFLRPTRGLLDGADRRALCGEGVDLRPYPKLWRADLLARLVPTRPVSRWGVWQR
ncbi:MAG: class I SAM-dependent methyltransferase [Thermoanaerobaculia bacterium]|nr:class I SAM-dependent methyltransferase [Thermoanaerobaculia bacterium]